MAESALAHIPPAIKVGGRRLSISSKHHHPGSSTGSPPNAPAPAPSTNETNSADDYPRPTHDTRSPLNHHDPQVVHTQHEEDIPHKEHNNKKVPKYDHVVRTGKHGANMPTRDGGGAGKGYGGAGRIAQPAGKSLGA